ncbi:MAG: hypothetical protein ACR2HR_12455 [Euzebya sp.]
MTIGRTVLVFIAVVTLVTGLLVLPGGAQEPPTVTAPSSVGENAITYEVTVQPGASGAGTSDCSVGGPENDVYAFDLAVPGDLDGTYSMTARQETTRSYSRPPSTPPRHCGPGSTPLQ